MPIERNIKFIASPSKSRFAEGQVRYQGQIQHNQVLNVKDTQKRLADFMGDKSHKVAGFLEGLGDFIAEQMALGNRVDFGPFSVGLKMRGSFSAMNAPFDAKEHVLAVELMPSKKIKAATAGLKPVNVTFDGRCYIFGNWQQTPYKAADEMAADGERTFVTGGSYIWVHPGAEGEGVWVENDLGVKLLEGVVTEADNGRVCSTFTGHVDPGRHWFVIASRRITGSELLMSRRRITVK